MSAAAPSFGDSVPIFAQPVAVGKMTATTIHAKTGSVVLEPPAASRSAGYAVSGSSPWVLL